MALIAGLLNGTNITYDYQFSLAARALLNNGIISGFLVSPWSVSAGEALIEVTRANGQKVLVAVTDLSAASLDTTGTKKVWISISQSKVDDGSLNATDGSGVASIQTGANYPAVGSFIKLASISAGAISDERVSITGKALARTGLTTKAVVVTDATGREVFITGTTGQNLGFNSENMPAAQNPAAVEADGETVSGVLGETVTIWDGKWAVFFGQGWTKTKELSLVNWATLQSFWNADATTRVGFYFTVPANTERVGGIQWFTLKLNKVGNPTDNLQIKIIDSAKAIVAWSSTILQAGTDMDIFPTDYSFGNINLSLSNSTKYYIELSRSGVLDATNYYQVSLHNASITSGHGFATYTGTTTTWSADNENDPYLLINYGFNYTVGQLWLSDYRYAETNLVDGIIVSGAVLTAGSTVKIRTEGILTQSGLTPWKWYYLAPTLGFFQASKGYSYPIGYAISSTQLRFTPVRPTSSIVNAEIPSTANFTITGANAAYVRYDAAWVVSGATLRTLSTSTRGSIVHMRIFGDFDVSKWKIDWRGKGMGAGFTSRFNFDRSAIPGDAGAGSGSWGTNFPSGGSGGGAFSSAWTQAPVRQTTPWTAGAAGKAFPQNTPIPRENVTDILVVGGLSQPSYPGFYGWGTSQWDGWGTLLLEVFGDVIVSSETRFDFRWTDPATPSATQNAYGGSGPGGMFLCYALRYSSQSFPVLVWPWNERPNTAYDGGGRGGIGFASINKMEYPIKPS